MVFKRFNFRLVKQKFVCFWHCFVCVYVLYDGKSSYPFLDVFYLLLIMLEHLAKCWSTIFGWKIDGGYLNCCLDWTEAVCLLLVLCVPSCGSLPTLFFFSIYWYICLNLRHVFCNLQVLQGLPLCGALTEFSQLMKILCLGTGLVSKHQSRVHQEFIAQQHCHTAPTNH